MVADRTLVTELGTALGTLAYPDLPAALSSRSPVLRIEASTWDQLDRLHAQGTYRRDFASAYENGRAFATAVDALAGRPPRLVEWTGGRRPPGDEVAPIDLRIDHVYLVSCKYLSANVANPSPARLFDGLLATTGTWDRTDWYQVVAPQEYQDLYAACRTATGLHDLPASATELGVPDRDRLRRALPRYPPEAEGPYRRLCAAVSARSAARWAEALVGVDPERMLWRLLRIGSAPYYLLGAHGASHLRLRVDTPWDWHHAYRLEQLTVAPARAGQPRVDWRARYAVRHRGDGGAGRGDDGIGSSDHGVGGGTGSGRSGGTRRMVEGHVEIRWSHGRFGQPPEAKVYLDTPVDQVPGYNPLEPLEPPEPGGPGDDGPMQGAFAIE